VIKRTQVIRLRDMLDSIDGVAEMVSGTSFADYQRDFKLRKAVERCVEIISEASRHVPELLKAEHPEQPWDEIAAIGNLLRHHYQRVDDHIMWTIATRSLPELRPAVLAMLQKAEQ
jgi:uncharacterized protein with HEPN domain